MKLDVVIPCFNEEGNLNLLYDVLIKNLDDIHYSLIFVNDGSVDKTLDILKELHHKNPEKVKVINLSRNFGQDAATYAGLKHSTSEYVASIDADLQHDPQYLSKMVRFLDENKEYDQISMVNKNRNKENAFIKFLKKSFYHIINKISDTKFVSGASDFRMYRRQVVEAIVSLEEKNRFSKGLSSWIGFNTYYMEYEVRNRHSGKTKYPLMAQFKYAFEGIVNFSVKPIRAISKFGLFISFISFIYLVYIIIKSLILKISIATITTLIFVIILLGGVQLIAIGLIGEYLTRTFTETKKRPIYIIKDKLGLNDEIL